MLIAMDAITEVPLPVNEPVQEFAPGAPERARLADAWKTLAADPIDLPHVSAGERIAVVQPPRHSARMGTLHNAGQAEATAAVEAAMAAKADWEATPFDE